jgi:hypothetical protein
MNSPIKKQRDYNDLPKLPPDLLENVFSVYEDENGKRFYNLLNSVHFPQNLPRSMFSLYQISYGDTWPYISYKTLGTPNAWWLILLANRIDNPLTMPLNGTRIKIPTAELARAILQKIRD